MHSGMVAHDAPRPEPGHRRRRQGPGRVDLFWGQGREAELSAGNMKQEGKLFFLVLKQRS